MSVLEKIEKARYIVSVMTNNVHFPSPLPDLPSVTASIDALEQAHANAQYRSPAETAIMHDKEETLEVMLNQLAAYVEFIAKGDDAIILSAGMEVRQQKGKKPQDFSVSNGKKEGEVILTTATTPRASYAWEVSTDPFPDESSQLVNSWKPAKISTVAKVTISNLKPGIKHWFRVAPIVREEQAEWSDPISIIVK